MTEAGRGQGGNQPRWQRRQQAWEGAGVSPGAGVQLAMMCFTKAGEKGRVSGGGSALLTPRRSLGSRAPPPEDLPPSEPTFIVDAAIGVLLPSHQFVHLFLCHPLT